MKTYIRHDANLRLLKRNSKMESDTVYILQSESAGSSQYFEKNKELKYARQMFRKHFEGCIDIYHELYTSRGLMLVVKVRGKNEIIDSWGRKGKLEKEVSAILSELMRYAISAIAKFRNRVHGRKGAVVRENFRLYEFKGEEEVKAFIGRLRKKLVGLYGQVGKYCGGVKSEVGYWYAEVCKIPRYVLRNFLKSTEIILKPPIQHNNLNQI